MPRLAPKLVGEGRNSAAGPVRSSGRPRRVARVSLLEAGIGAGSGPRPANYNAPQFGARVRGDRASNLGA